MRCLFFWLVLPFMVCLSFYGIFLKWEKNYGIICYKFFAIIFFALLKSSCFNLHVHFRRLSGTPIIYMPLLNRNEEVACDNCGTQTTKLNPARHKKRCSVGTLYCIQCPTFSTISQNDVNYHIVKKQTAPKLDVIFVCKLCNREFPRFYALRQHRNTQHGMQIGSRTRVVDVEHIVVDVEDHRLREELRSFQHFLVDSEFERARHRIFNYAVETLYKTIVYENFDGPLKNLKCAAKVNLVFGFNLQNIEDGGFRYFYAPKNNISLDRSTFLCTHDDSAKLKDFLNTTDVRKSCKREMNISGGSTS